MFCLPYILPNDMVMRSTANATRSNLNLSFMNVVKGDFKINSTHSYERLQSHYIKRGLNHRIGIHFYATMLTDVPKNEMPLMSFMFNNDAFFVSEYCLRPQMALLTVPGGKNDSLKAGHYVALCQKLLTRQ
jgi:hypothetical protein